MSTAATSFYVTGGTLRSDAPSYLERRADRDLYEGLTQGEFCYVLTARQMGKSSLMVRTAARLREEGVAVVVLDLTAIGQNLSPEQWYDGLRDLLGQQLDLEEELDDFWQEQGRLGPLQRWMKALREVVLDLIPGRIVIFVDEIDAVRSLPFSTDEFFAGLREGYNRRTEDPEFGPLTFCLLGVASPSDLIRDTRTTPFNIGRRIELTDFSEAEAAPLAQGLGRKGETGKALLQRVLYWTGGHPYLTQRLCQAVAEDATVTQPSGVDRLCEILFLSPRARERDDNLLFVRERLLHSDADLASLLDLYAQVRRGKRVRDDEMNPLVSLLRLSGITRLGIREASGGALQVRNRIYARVFDREWVAQHMPDAELRRQRVAYRQGLLRAGGIAGVIIALIVALVLVAVDQARRAIEGQRTLRRERYAAQMNVAQQAWEVGNRDRARELLDAQRPQPGQEELRGFEWGYLWRLCQSDARFTLRAHMGPVFSVVFSPDGKSLATGSADRTVKLWDIATRRVVATLQGHTADVWSVAFSPDGKLLASGGNDQTVKLWDVVARREVATIRVHLNGQNAVAFSPDGKTLATGTADGALKLWDLATRREAVTLKGHQGGVAAVAFSPDGKTLATGGDLTVRLWDVTARRKIATLRGHTDAIDAMAFSPDGSTLASVADDGTVRLWNPTTKQEVATLRGHPSMVLSVAFSPDGKILATGSEDMTIKLWNARTKEEMTTLKGHTATVWSGAFSRDGKTLATGSQDGTVKLWDAALWQESDVLRGHTGGVWRVAFAPKGKILASSSMDGTVRLWDPGTRRTVATLQGHTGNVPALAFSPDGKTLATGSADNTVKLWDVTARRAVATLQGHTGGVWSVAFSPDGKLLASGSGRWLDPGDQTVKLWEVASRREVATLRVPVGPRTTVAFSPDGKTLATATASTSHLGSSVALQQNGDEGTVKLWDVATKGSLGPRDAIRWGRPSAVRTPAATLKGHQEGIDDVAFSPDGKILATGSQDRTVKLWDVGTKAEVGTLKGHLGTADSVSFAPDGKTLATGGADRAVRLWNVATKQEVATLRGHRGPVWCVAFSPDGSILASGGADGTVRLWRTATFAETDAPAGARVQPAFR